MKGPNSLMSSAEYTPAVHLHLRLMTRMYPRSHGGRMRATVFRFFLTILMCVSAATAQQRISKTASQPASKSGSPSSEQRSGAATQPQPCPEIERLVEAFQQHSSTCSSNTMPTEWTDFSTARSFMCPMTAMW